MGVCCLPFLGTLGRTLILLLAPLGPIPRVFQAHGLRPRGSGLTQHLAEVINVLFIPRTLASGSAARAALPLGLRP